MILFDENLDSLSDNTILDITSNIVLSLNISIKCIDNKKREYTLLEGDEVKIQALDKFKNLETYEGKIKNIIDKNSITIDCSTKYNSDVVHINIKSIRSISYINKNNQYAY